MFWINAQIDWVAVASFPHKPHDLSHHTFPPILLDALSLHITVQRMTFFELKNNRFQWFHILFWIVTPPEVWVLLIWTRWYPLGIQRLVSTHWGEGYSWELKTQSPKSWPNFHFRGGGGIVDTTFLKYLSGGTQGMHQKFYQPSLLLHHR